ncbi:unnamed protein product, partial [marine sediment metagenome]
EFTHDEIVGKNLSALFISLIIKVFPLSDVS